MNYYSHANNQLGGARKIYDRIARDQVPLNFGGASRINGLSRELQDVFSRLSTGNRNRSYLSTLAPRSTPQRSQDIVAAMQPFMNAFDDQVIDQALTRLGEARDGTLSDIGAEATRAGAFGGSRHALLEAKANEDYMRNSAEVASGLKQQSFAQAMQQALGIDSASDAFNLNRANTFMQGDQLDLQTAIAEFNALLSGTQTNQAADQLDLAGDQFDINRLLQAAQGRVGTSNTYYDRVTNQEDRLYAQGAAQQQLNQSVLDTARQQFQQSLSDPYRAMELMTSLLQTDPRNRNFTQTGSTSGTSTAKTRHGLFDYLGLGLQTLGAGGDAGIWSFGG